MSNFDLALGMPSRKRDVGNSATQTSETNLATKKKRSLLSTKVEFIAESRRCTDKSIFCPRCDSTLSSKTFRKHRSLYFDSEKDTWTKIGDKDNVLSTNIG